MLHIKGEIVKVKVILNMFIRVSSLSKQSDPIDKQELGFVRTRVQLCLVMLLSLRGLTLTLSVYS